MWHPNLLIAFSSKFVLHCHFSTKIRRTPQDRCPSDSCVASMGATRAKSILGASWKTCAQTPFEARSKTLARVRRLAGGSRAAAGVLCKTLSPAPRPLRAGTDVQVPHLCVSLRLWRISPKLHHKQNRTRSCLRFLLANSGGQVMSCFGDGCLRTIRRKHARGRIK